MRRRMRGACVALLLVTALCASGEPVWGEGLKPKLTVTRLAYAPLAASPGSRFAIRLHLRSSRRRTQRRRQSLVVLLSRNRRVDSKDKVIGRRRLKRLPRRGRRGSARVMVRLPRGLREGNWRFLGCAATRTRRGRLVRRCRSAPYRVEMVKPDPPTQPDGRRYPCTNRARKSAPDIDVEPGPRGARGRVLPGRALQSAIVNGEPSPLDPAPPAPDYPGGQYPAGPPAWMPVTGGTSVFASRADARFNGEDAAHRVAFHLSHYGGQPDTAGDFDTDGVQDFLVTEHFSYVDGKRFAGEVHLYYGRRGGRLDPRRQVPDVVFYGDETDGKLGLSIGPAGDVNGDGWKDVIMSAGFHSQRTSDGTTIPDGGEIYVVYGGYLQAFGCTVKVRAEDIGDKVPGLTLEGGHDGASYAGWANDLEAGDVNGDGLGDVLAGAADPYTGSAPTFAARAYLVYGSRGLPLRRRGYRLGVDRDVDGIASDVFEAPNGEVTRRSLGFGAFIPGDLDGDGREDVVLCAGAGGPSGNGIAYVFRGQAGSFGAGVVPFDSADTRVVADESSDPRLIFRLLESVRPAGDVNGDGRKDFVFGARATFRRINDQWRSGGAAAIFYGRHTLPAQLGMSQLDVFMLGRNGGIGHPAMDRGADFDGDGYSDLLLNNPYFTEPIGGEQQWRGRLWIVRGGPALPRTVEVEDAAAVTLLADTSIPGMFGYTWNTGDFNDDGRPDIVVGDHYAGDQELHDHAGRVYMFYNGRSFTVP